MVLPGKNQIKFVNQINKIMKNRLPGTTILFAIVILSVFTQCDIAQKDQRPVTLKEENLNYLTVSQLPTIIRLEEGIKISSASNVEIETTANKGSLEFISDGKFLKYTPNSDFTTGSDEFVLKVNDASADFTKKSSIKITMLQRTGCGQGGVFSYAKIKAGESLVVDLLANDLFCDWNGKGNSIGIREIPIQNFEGAEIRGSTSGVTGTGKPSIMLHYTPPNGFTGKVEFTYEICIDFADEQNHPSNWGQNDCGYFISSLATIEVVP